MSRRWIQNPNRCAYEYLDGIKDVTDFARTHNPGATRIRCLCRRCNNTLWETIENVQFHLVRNAMIETYITWTYHGEQLDIASSSRATRVENVEPIADPNEQVMDIINYAFPFASMDSAEFEQYEKLLQNANQELYSGCENFSVLTAIVELMHEKIKYHMSNLCFDMRWHKKKWVDDDVMRHPVDEEAWKEFNRTFPEFAADPRNVRLGLATDGFNPYGVLN
ncbi:hypothetical protein L3X38_037130 [Prunus dulcis]|uniref:Transposase-associated domain-containing protein n=1 Tax=Prunus dulcis TaxID=3755 RepID=A0AAD4YR01_PRUDU|nr:hypothetical protein L3X38_037130 [Prunus dulcis]